jgi:hypothetical protein
VDEGAPPSVDEVLAVGIEAATAYGRTDLADRLRTARETLGRSTATVLFVGEFKAGKSSLVNAVAGADVCPVDDDVATAVLTVLRHHPEPAAAVVSVRDGEQQVDRIALEDAAAVVVGGGALGPDAVARVEIGLPSPLLAGGLVLVDTPGAGGLGGPQGAVTMAAAARSDAVVFVTAATHELTDSELAYLRQVRALCDTVVVVETKTDLHPSWRRIARLDAGHCADVGVDAAWIGVSSALAPSDDAGLRDESGVPALVDWLLTDVAGAHRERRIDRVVEALTDTVGQLRATFEAERDALFGEGDGDEQESVAGAEDAVAAARAMAARWGQVLADGFSDLVTHLDRDLRDRARGVLADAEAAIDGIDPGRGWGAFERGLYEQTAAAATAHAQLRHERLVEAIARVAAVFGDGEAAWDGFGAPSEPATNRPSSSATFSPTAPGILSNALVVLRSSYGGLAMVGFLGGFAGIVVAAPVLAAVGVALGGKGFRDERARQLAQHRAQAKVAVRRYLDEITYVLGNETRDTVRHVQREVRDHFSAQAAERQAAAAAALASARSAVALDADARRRRLADVDAELRRIDSLAARVAAVRNLVAP